MFPKCQELSLINHLVTFILSKTIKNKLEIPMENVSLLKHEVSQSPLPENQKPKSLPYFIIIQKSESKKLRIPCVNEKVAAKLLSMVNRQA